MLAAIEGALQKSYAGFGRAVPGRLAIVTLAVAAVLLAVAGVGYVAVEKETDVFDLWVDDTSRLKSELDFYDDNFGGSRTQSLIVTPKTKDVNLLTPEALDEVKEITRWFRDLQYKANVNGKEETITHADICSKAVETTNADPCFVFSPLDCFMEGRYAVVGEENNHVPWQGYDGRGSAQCINHDNPALRTNLTYEYLRDKCRYFFNIKYPYHIVFGGPRWKDPATKELKHPWFRPEAVSEHGNLTLDSVKSFRLLFPTLDEKLLHEKGVRKVDFKQAQERDEDVLTCPRAACENAPLHGNADCDCTTCTNDGQEGDWFNALVALQYDCEPLPTLPTQKPKCCDWMKRVREHPCVEHLWAWNAQAVQTGAYVLQQCGLPPVRPFIAVDRCKESKLAPNITTTTTTATPPAADHPECWPSNPTEMCGAAALTLPLAECIGGVANDACCGALKDNIGADSDKSSSRCFCYDAIVEGAKASLAQYNSTADLGAIIDTCNTDFGANVPYAGGTSSSSTCSCAAPAPECWPSNPTEMCGAAALTLPLAECIGGVANDACCGALKDNIGADSDKSSSRCFCYDAIVEGAKASLAQYNSTADLGAIIDTCNTDFGANVPYAGGTSSSSTCSCAAPAPECWPSNPTEMCGAAALTLPLAECIGGVANDACCGALKDNIGADSDKSSSRCFCYDAIVEGAKASLAQYNSTADLGAIIDTCNTDFGANVPYAGGTSSSSTCSCAAPAPECWPSNPTEMCGAAALTLPLAECIGGVANDACCGALKDNIGADSDKSSSRCFCYDAIVEGAKASLAQYNSTADLGAIIDTCNTDFGANVPYAGGTSSSSTCSCAAPAPECWPSNPTEMCGAAALTLPLAECIGGVANDACCGALKDNIGADSDKSSSRCFCYDAIVEGAKASLAQYNSTADLGAIIDTCNTDFGANVPYAGGTSSSSTCSCAAPAPECWPSNPTEMCGAAALTLPLAECIGGVANDACCGALKDNIGADSDKSSSRCFCYDAIVEGAKASLAQYNSTADLGAIIDTCNTDFGANVPYAGGTSSSSTCSCAAPAPECWPSNPTEMCGAAALTLPLAECIGGVANDACCGALKDNIGADSDKSSSRCFCYDAIVEGAKASLAQYNSTADLGAIIDTCNTDFGANVPYAGGTSSSSTCSCAAPAPECWPSNPTEMCGAAALTLPLAECIGGVANDACCGALKDNIGADSDKSSSRCFCYDAIVEGAKASLAQYNSTADLGAIIDTCNKDFGANVPYANGTSSSSTCSCAAPAPTTSTTTMTTTKPEFCSSPAYPLGGKSDTVSTTLKVASEKEAYDILYGWENLWTKSISAELANSTKYKHIKVSYLSGSSVEDTIKDASNSQIPLLVLGYGLVIVYTVSLFLPFNPLAQRPDVGVVPPGPLAAVAVVCFIALSTWGALGIAGAISTGDVKFNALTLQVVPFLALGLGVNDFLVLAQSLSTCYAERPLEADATSIIAETMRHGGVSVTLSSVTNTFAFLLGMLSGIPAVRAFALHIALAELFNFLLTLFVFPSILFLETRRFLAMDKEQGKAAPAPGAGKEVTESRAKKIVDFFNTPLGMAVRVFLAVLSVALLIFCAFGIPDVKVGLRLTDVIPKGKPLHKYAVDVEDVYCTSPVYLTYRGMDYEKIVEDSLKLNYEFVKDGHNMDFIYEVTSHYNYYLEFIEGQLQSDEVCTWEVTYVKDPWRETINTCEGKNSTACEADCKSRNTEGAQKAAPADKKCKYSNETNTCYCPYRPMLKPEYFYNISTDVKLDEADHQEETESGTNIRILDKFFDGPVNGRVSKFLTGQAYDRISAANDTYGKLTAARTLTFAENMCSYDERIKHIKRGREIADASSLNAKGMSPGGKMKNVFPFDWIVYALTEQYLHIEHQTLIALVICCITIFVVMMPFVVHPATSLLVTSVIVKILAELYGLIFWTGLKLNAVTMINLLISVGVAVELTAHVGREFMVSQGTRLERAVKAASDMAWPLTNGALSTFIGIIAIAFSDYEYFRNYFFMQYLLILVISLWNGLVFLPSLLSVVGPPAYNAGEGAGSSAGKDPEQGKSDKA